MLNIDFPKDAIQMNKKIKQHIKISVNNKM